MEMSLTWRPLFRAQVEGRSDKAELAIGNEDT